MSLQSALVVMGIVLLLSGCTSRDSDSSPTGSDGAGTADTGSTNAGASDAGAGDSGIPDKGSSDRGSADAGTTDAATVDAGSTDTGSTVGDTTDNGSTDSGLTDMGSADSGNTDSASLDAGSTDTGSTDSGTSDNGSTDSGSTDMGSTDSGTTGSGSLDSGSTDAGSTDAELQVSCSVINTQALLNDGGFVRTVLPADLSQPGAQISIQSIQAGQFTAFDSASGAVDYVPDTGRLPITVEYQVNDAEGVILARHEHRWVFDPVRVMPLGDSITSGVEYFDGAVDQPLLPERVGYRKFLYDRLIAGDYPIDYVGQSGQNAGAAAGLADQQNNGYPGVDIAFINNKLLEVLGDDSADIILLHIGTNNTPQNAAAIDSLLITLDTWEAENHPVLALVATITPKRDVARNAEVDEFNQDLRSRIAARVNDRVLLVEQNTGFSLTDISDEQIGIHPNAGGYQKMADVWFDALTNAESDALAKCPP